MAVGVINREIVLGAEEKKPGYWAKLFKGRSFRDSVGGRKWGSVSVATWGVTRLLEFALDDIMHEGTEVGFWGSDREPYMLWFIKDLKYVVKRYKYKAKFRGHMYKFGVYAYPAFRRVAKLRYIGSHMGYFIYQHLSKLVKNGMDYPDMPNIKVFETMKKSYHDRK